MMTFCAAILHEQNSLEILAEVEVYIHFRSC